MSAMSFCIPCTRGGRGAPWRGGTVTEGYGARGGDTVVSGGVARRRPSAFCRRVARETPSPYAPRAQADGDDRRTATEPAGLITRQSAVDGIRAVAHHGPIGSPLSVRRRNTSSVRRACRSAGGKKRRVSVFPLQVCLVRKFLYLYVCVCVSGGVYRKIDLFYH